jgi:hypothetical protein
MNEISRLIEAYDRLWSNIEIMQQDVTYVIENDFQMESFDGGELDHNIVHNIYFKGKMAFYVVIDLSVEIPYLQMFKLNFPNEKENVTREYLKEGKYKGWNPNNIFDEEETKEKKLSENFILWTNSWVECVISPKIDILSITSTDIVNLEIKKLILALVESKYKGFSTTELKIIE